MIVLISRSVDNNGNSSNINTTSDSSYCIINTFVHMKGKIKIINFTWLENELIENGLSSLET